MKPSHPLFNRIFFSFFGTLILTSCSPKIYLIDRQTVLEDEAAGEWPELEKELFKKLKAQGPTPFAKIETSTKKDQLYRVLNGELTQTVPRR